MRYIESPSLDAYWNMALEEYVFTQLPKEDGYFMFWQNRRAVVVGKYQNTAEEINASYIRGEGVQVVRRLSGGGAMYQDEGNLNFTFVVDQAGAKSLDFGFFIQPVVQALRRLGVNAVQNGRNDITVDDKKVSGNAQYNRQGRTMHHGTLLFASDLSAVAAALHPGQDKLESKAIASVRSRVTNIADHLTHSVTLPAFKSLLREELFTQRDLQPYALTAYDSRQIERLSAEKYATWDWNYGRSPAYNIRKQRRFPFGGVTVCMQVEKGIIRQLALSGDFFGNAVITQLELLLQGCRLSEQDLRKQLADADINEYIAGLDIETFCELLLL